MGGWQHWASATINIASGPTHHFSESPPAAHQMGRKKNSLQNSNHLSRASLIRSFSIWRREKVKRKNVQHFSFDIYQNPQQIFQTLLFNLFSFGNCLLGSKSSLAHLFKMTELFCLFLEIEMFSPQNLLDFVGFMQMTC